VSGDRLGESIATSVGLSDLIAGLADNKCLLGRRYAEWCTSAPTLESAVAAAAMAQDEIGHARSFYPLLKDIAGTAEMEPDPELEPETRTVFVNAQFLDAPFESWTDFIAANLLFDTALTVLLEAATESSFGPLAQRARRILEEEPLHWLHAVGWTRRLASQGQAVREALEASFSLVAPEALTWFEVATPDLITRQVLGRSCGELRDTFRSRINTILGPTDLAHL
jgi:ring-1,2-phenylacetyl-CoA epoxidase subunit PaaC